MLLRHDHIRQQPWILASTCPERDFAFALELGLHSLAMAKVGAMIKVLSTDKQVIVATQSPLLVDAFCVDELFVLEMEQGRPKPGSCMWTSFNLGWTTATLQESFGARVCWGDGLDSHRYGC